MPKKPRSRSDLEPPLKNWVRVRLRADDNLDQLLILVCVYIRDHLFPTCPSPDPIDLQVILIRRLGEELRKGILEKLKRYFPKDAHREEALLVKYHPDRATGLLQQGLGFLVDLWNEDTKRHRDDSEDTLAEKCQRLLPSLSNLPDRRGKSALGETSRLFGLVVFDDVRALLKGLPRVRQGNLTEDDVTQRKQFFSGVLSGLMNNATGISPPPPAVVKDRFAEAAASDYEAWKQLSRTQIALDVAARVMKQTPDYLAHSISQLRKKASGRGIKPLKPTL